MASGQGDTSGSLLLLHAALEAARTRWDGGHTWRRTAVGSPVDADVSVAGLVKTFLRKSSTGLSAWAPWTDALPESNHERA